MQNNMRLTKFGESQAIPHTPRTGMYLLQVGPFLGARAPLELANVKKNNNKKKKIRKKFLIAITCYLLLLLAP